MLVPLIVGLIFIFIGALFIIQFLQIITLLQQHKKQTIADAIPHTKAEISGDICPTTNLITSPVTKTTCAYWEVYVYTSRTNDERASSRATLLSLSSNYPFIIKDYSHKILIRIDRASPSFIFSEDSLKSVVKINKGAYFTDRQGLFAEFSGAFTADFLAAHNIETSQFLGSRRNLTVVEKILVPGDKVFAWGTVEIYGNQKVLHPKLVSDHSRTLQIMWSLYYMVIGLFFISMGFVFIHIFLLNSKFAQ